MEESTWGTQCKTWLVRYTCSSTDLGARCTSEHKGAAGRAAEKVMVAGRCSEACGQQMVMMLAGCDAPGSTPDVGHAPWCLRAQALVATVASHRYFAVVGCALATMADSMAAQMAVAEMLVAATVVALHHTRPDLEQESC
jgi:hypothetical protein